MTEDNGTITQRPWGTYEKLKQEPGIWIKRVEVAPGKRLSLQKHFHRSEHWVVAFGEGIARIGKKEIPVREAMSIDIPVGTVHRLTNTGKDRMVIIEVAFGHPLTEEDIERLDDDYARHKTDHPA